MREINPWAVAVRGDRNRAAVTGFEDDIYELTVLQTAVEMGGLMNYYICQWGQAIHQVLAFLQRVEAPNADAQAGVPHRRRQVLKARTPLHVTVRCGEGAWRLRRRTDGGSGA